ncbi:hypothetical protein [Xenorhabdus miraniensis]|uniref:Uncharacterized protein n=1 Tax=Xenorhabdus miraniensis TaxID=351674 RepID=A0A2D0JMH4_9GAMM|nr:hypothetical protein [Xenorhabdus miraniensis]PHM47515.1 hypothetical protein Xmir_03067 [Xenorhabdus miraniensis]
MSQINTNLKRLVDSPDTNPLVDDAEVPVKKSESVQRHQEKP